MCFYIVSFSAQVVESLKGFGQEYRRQVVPEVVHAHLEELLLSKLLGTGKSRGSPPCNELRDRFIIPLLGLMRTCRELIQRLCNTESLSTRMPLKQKLRRMRAQWSMSCPKDLRAISRSNYEQAPVWACESAISSLERSIPAFVCDFLTYSLTRTAASTLIRQAKATGQLAKPSS